jgi:hypothetical protein
MTQLNPASAMPEGGSSSDQCALRADGTLKDASEIVWHHDKDDDVPMAPLSPGEYQFSSSVPSYINPYISSDEATTEHSTDARNSRRRTANR